MSASAGKALGWALPAAFLVILCCACGGGGSSASAPAAGPHLSTVPSAQAGYPGDTVTFHVVADGTGNTYQWQRNGSAIAGATTDTYALPVLLADDQALFSVKVTASAGGGVTTSPNALLDVLYAYPAVIPGQDHTLAITTKGVVYAWGYNGHGQLGQGDYQARMVPTVVPLPGRAAQVAAGWAHTVVLLTNGTVYAWGANAYGQLGDNTTTERPTPAQVPGLSNIIAIASGYDHVFAYGQTGSAWIWGKNYFGQLGQSDTVDRHVPTPITVPTLQDLSMGRDHTVMVTTTGALLGCGDNSYGQLGLPWASPSNSYPTLTSLGSGAATVRTFNYATAILDSSGHPWATGQNNYGGLGDGTTTSRWGWVPMDVTALPAGSTLAAVAPGEFHTLLLTSQGAVAGTGYNWYGQLGLGIAIPNQYTTAQLIPGFTAAGVYPGYYSSYAVLPDLSVKVWGYNANGRLGDGTSTDHYAPTSLVGFSLGPAPTGVPGVRVGAKGLAQH